MSSDLLETLLARLYANPLEVERFLCDRLGYAMAAGLSEEDAELLRGIDAESLRFAALSYARKRSARH